MPTMAVLFALAGVASYLILVRALRYRRMRITLHRYRSYEHDSASLGQMTLEDAFAIQLPLAELEFPLTFSISIFFALFKTYGIPSISKLLVATGELSDSTTASKRAADTGVLITEIVLNKPGTERNLSAIARMNWLHDRYRRAGKINDDDMLYTLSLFTLEPMRWTRSLEWRNLTDLERCAMAVYWKNLGEVMGIPYHRLRSSATGWQNGLEWLDELEAWSQEYEVDNMVPSPSNRVLAVATVKIGLTNVPSSLQPLGVQFASALLNARLRRAMMLVWYAHVTFLELTQNPRFEEPASWVQNSLDLAITVRKWLIRHVFLPRPAFLRQLWFTEADKTTGKYHFEQYIGHPWYIKPTLARRWNLKSWLLWLTGGFVPSKSRPEFHPEGYSIPDLGPNSLHGKGLAEMEAATPMIRTLQGCPFHTTRRG